MVFLRVRGAPIKASQVCNFVPMFARWEGRRENRDVLRHTFMRAYVHTDTHACVRRQNFVLRHLIEDRSLLLDLSGDYSSPINQRMIPRDDPRQGQTLLDLMLSQDHLNKYFSLFRYHVSSLEILALCASQNRVSQLMIQGMLPLKKVLDSIMALNAREDKYAKIDVDTLCLAKRGWIELLASAYLDSNNPDIGDQIVHIASTHILSTDDKHLNDDDNDGKLLAEVTTTMTTLTERLTTLTKQLLAEAVVESMPTDQLAAAMTNNLQQLLCLVLTTGCRPGLTLTRNGFRSAQRS